MGKIAFERNNPLDYRSNEAYKTIRTNLFFSGNDVKTILLTSCTVNEGKSSIAFYLANSFAQAGKRVLLIDADLRKSVFVGQYRITTQVQGLSHYLSDQCEFKEILSETNIENFHIILAGKTPPNPSELLGSEKFQHVLEMVRNQYDYVILDTPPLGSVIDAAVMAPFCDGSILVVANDKISKRFAREVKLQLERSNQHILGAILNNVDVSKQGYYDGYYNKYYRKYYGKET